MICWRSANLARRVARVLYATGAVTLVALGIPEGAGVFVLPLGGAIFMARATTQPARRLVPVNEAAAYVSVTRRTLERAINRGELQAYKLGRRCTRIDLNELEALMINGPKAG